MLIPFGDLFQKYRLKVKGVLHVGAHLAEEAQAYQDCGVPWVLWVEGNPDLMGDLNAALQPFAGQEPVLALISDKPEESVPFNITRDPEGTAMSSSLLELHVHKKHAPWVKQVAMKRLDTTTIDLLADEYPVINDCNFLNLDIQGAELLALKGAEKFLTHCDYIYTEVNTNYLYKDCVLLPELDGWLGGRGFVRKELSMTPAEWGDGFYVKEN